MYVGTSTEDVDAVGRAMVTWRLKVKVITPISQTNRTVANTSDICDETNLEKMGKKGDHNRMITNDLKSIWRQYGKLT